MANCILCEKPLPQRSETSKKGKDLVCAACNKSIDRKLDAGVAKERKKLAEHKELQKRIKSLEKLSKELKEMIEMAPDACGATEDVAGHLPKEIQPYLFTPLKSYKMVQFLLAVAQGEYMDSITKQDSEVRLENALQNSIKNEDYRKSAVLFDKIKEKKEKKPKPEKK